MERASAADERAVDVMVGEVSCRNGMRTLGPRLTAESQTPSACIPLMVFLHSSTTGVMSWGGSRSLLDPDGDGSTLVRKVPVSSGSILHLFLLVSRYLAKSMHIRGIRSAFSPARIKCLSISGFQPFKVARFPKYDALSMPLV